MTKGFRPSNRRSTPGYKARRQWQRKVERARRVSIMDVARYIGCGPFEDAGRSELRCLCVFHRESHPSLFLNTEKGLWCCHACGVGGDAIALYMLGTGVSFKQAVVELAVRF